MSQHFEFAFQVSGRRFAGVCLDLPRRCDLLKAKEKKKRREEAVLRLCRSWWGWRRGREGAGAGAGAGVRGSVRTRARD